MAELPASFLQEEIVSSVDGDLSNNNVPVVIALTGRLNRAALKRALAALVERHETLRTSFVRRAEGLRQRIAPPTPATLETVDLQPDMSPYKRLAYLLYTELYEPFRLTDSPLWRGVLFVLPGDRSILSLTLHHAISDRWSGDILRADLAALYRAEVTGDTPGLSPLQLQFGDYAAWQRRSVDPASVARWRERLTPLPPAPGLPDSGTWRPGESCTHEAQPLPPIPKAATTALQKLAAECNATPADAIHAATAAALSPFFEREMLLGIVYAIRDSTDLSRIVGPLIDHLPVLVTITDDTTFLDLIRQVSNAVHRRHTERVPLGAISAALADQLPPDTPIFSVQVNYFPYAARRAPSLQAIDAAGLRFAPFSVATTDRIEITSDREFPLATRLGYVLRGNPDGTLEGATFANVDALSRDHLDVLTVGFADALSLLSEHPDEPIRSLSLRPADCTE